MTRAVGALQIGPRSAPKWLNQRAKLEYRRLTNSTKSPAFSSLPSLLFSVPGLCSLYRYLSGRMNRVPRDGTMTRIDLAPRARHGPVRASQGHVCSRVDEPPDRPRTSYGLHPDPVQIQGQPGGQPASRPEQPARPRHQLNTQVNCDTDSTAPVTKVG